MIFATTTATRKIAGLTKRIRGIAGGTSASKTISCLLYLIARAQSDATPTLTSIVSETIPHLKRGAMRDFLNIMQGHNYYREERWNRTEFIYTFETGSKIEFFSADSPSKMRGSRRDRLYINEANNVLWEAADQMIVRTRELVLADWNPTNEFWWYTEIIPNRDHDFLTLTYKDNEALSQQIVDDIESHRNNANWWRVYGLGQLGEVEGKIYKGWKLDIEEVPHEARLERRGLDFGYSNDPAALVDIYYYNGGYIFDEQLYRKGMSNKAIADLINNLKRPDTLVIADSAEPKSIDELRVYGIPTVPAQKGQGSVSQGIQYVQDQQISVTKRSTNLIREYRNYLWMTDKEGNLGGKDSRRPTPGQDHALDAIRYGMESLRPVIEEDWDRDEVNSMSLIY